MLSAGKANIFSSETAINCSPLSFWKYPNTVKSHIGSEGTSQSWNLPPSESIFTTEVQKTNGVEWSSEVPLDGVTWKTELGTQKHVRIPIDNIPHLNWS